MHSLATKIVNFVIKIRVNIILNNRKKNCYINSGDNNNSFMSLEGMILLQS